MKRIIKWTVIATLIFCVVLGIGGYVVYRNRAVIANKAMNYAMLSLTGSAENGTQTWLGGLLEGDSAKDVKDALINAVLGQSRNTNKVSDSADNTQKSQNSSHRINLATMADMLVNGVNDGEKADLGQVAQALLTNLSGEKLPEKPTVHDINARDTKGRTLLMNVCRVDVTPKVIKMILHFGADINAVDENGRNALMYAVALNENPEVVQMLLEKGADANLKDMNGKSVWEYAKTDEMRELVEKYIAKTGWF